MRYPPRLLLGIDLGTTGLKAVVFDLDGQPLGKGLAANEYVTGRPGHAEQDPRMWWAGCCRAIASAMAQAQVDPAGIAGIGVCGFHHCPVLLDSEGEPAHSCLVTHDSRLGDGLQDLAQSGVLEQVVRLSGSRVMTGHFPPIWQTLLAQEPGALRETRWILLAKDYIRFKLTGQIGTEICDATGTNLVAMPEQEWSTALCKLLQVPPEKLPAIGRPEQVAGYLTAQAARATGLLEGTPVVYGGGDSHCALVGLGVVEGSVGEPGPSTGLLLGTNSTLRTVSDGFVRRLGVSVWAQQHVVPGRYTVSASSMAGSSVLSWLRELWWGQSAPDSAEIYREMEEWAAGVPPGSDGVLFHPYLYGERSPFCNPEAGGAFLALRHRHHRGHLIRAAMEGVAFCIANCVDLLAGATHPAAAVRTAQSGGARLPLWRQIIADAMELPLDVVGVEEPGCLGAALLAGVGVGQYADLADAIGRTVHVRTRISPDAGRAALYREKRKTFDSTYRALEPILYRKTTGDRPYAEVVD